MPHAMGARVLIPSILRRIGCSSFGVNSVVLPGQLLLSSLDSLHKLAVGRLEPKLATTVQSLTYSLPQSTAQNLICRLTTSCPVFTVPYTFLCVLVSVTLLRMLLRII